MTWTVEGVWDEFDSGLRGFIRGRVRDHHAAEDILQEVYLKIHAHIGGLRDEERVQSWVYQVARNAIADHYRRSRPTTVLGDVPYHPVDLADDEAARALAGSVRRLVDSLPPDYREALILTEYEGLTQVQLAARLGISVSGAKSRVQRARSHLKAALLACCHFELDRLGGIIDYQARDACCVDCGDSCAPGVW